MLKGEHEGEEAVRMRSTTTRGLVVLVVLLLGAALAWRLDGAKQTEDRQDVSQERTQWEYLVVEVLDTDWQTEMNTHGGQGWELVSARRVLETYGARLKTYLERGFQPDIKYQCIFKRPRRP